MVSTKAHFLWGSFLKTRFRKGGFLNNYGNHPTWSRLCVASVGRGWHPINSPHPPSNSSCLMLHSLRLESRLPRQRYKQTHKRTVYDNISSPAAPLSEKCWCGEGTGGDEMDRSSYTAIIYSWLTLRKFNYRWPWRRCNFGLTKQSLCESRRAKKLST